MIDEENKVIAKNPRIKTILKELTTVGLGAVAIAGIIALGWLIFPGVSWLGSSVENLCHWHLSSECFEAQDNELICRSSSWAVGLLTLLIVPLTWFLGMSVRSYWGKHKKSND